MKQYTVDAFTEKVFAGNPAAVCIMDKWLPDDIMQKLAIENNLSETAYVITRFIEPACQKICFDTKSGLLTVKKNDGLLEMEYIVHEQ